MDNVWTRQMGDARIAVISEGSGWIPVARLLENVPEAEWRQAVEADAEGRMLLGFNVAHVTLPGASILIDTGIGSDDPNDPTRPETAVRHVTLTAGLRAGLSALSVRPEEITHVVLSHMHWDHMWGATVRNGAGRKPGFPNARVCVLRDEWAAAPTGHGTGAGVELDKPVLEAAGLVDLYDGEAEIVPGIRLIPAPGESPGHAVIRIASDGEVVYYVGDLFHGPAEFAHPDWTPPWRDRKALLASRERLLPRFVSESAWIIPTHNPFPAIGRVEHDGAGYRWASGV
ncbi:MAG: MBL fold metallo-hydrolase [Chloroflexi bacterium]|nr:MBL fold metallo-hydrolase [Chloroflexota bacterium]